MKHILAAVDGSGGSMRALEVAADLAAKSGGDLMLIDVVEHGEPPDWALAEHVRLDQIYGDMPRLAEAFARDTLAKAKMQAEARGARWVRSEVRFGDAAEEILRLQAEAGADTIVVGSRGRGRLAGLLLGSVSQKVVSLAPCTVTIAR